MKRIAVYCGSATPADERYITLARTVGETLARRNIGVVYGGGMRGLMGAVAAAALAGGPAAAQFTNTVVAATGSAAPGGGT